MIAEIHETYIADWQRVVDIMADVLDVPAGLVMRVYDREIEVFVSSSGAENPYQAGHREELNGALYCETVMKDKAFMLVPNAAKDHKWQQSPDVGIGMTYYMGFPLLWPDGEVFGTICVLDRKDNPHATRYKELLFQFRHIVEGDLRSIVETEQLRSEHKVSELLSTRLAEKNEELENILRISSHDLRSPTINIKGFSDMLVEGCGQLHEMLGDTIADNEKAIELIENEIPEMVGFITASADKLASLIDIMVEVSSLDKVELNFEIFDMNHLMNSIAKEIAYDLVQNGIDLKIDKLPDCYGDRRQIWQAFSNLLGNAVKYIGNGNQITLTCKTSPEENIYCVTDNGMGIEQAKQNKIFELFYKGNSVNDINSRGIGLNIVKRIVEIHHGKLWVESERNKGSKFFIALPKGPPS